MRTKSSKQISEQVLRICDVVDRLYYHKDFVRYKELIKRTMNIGWDYQHNIRKYCDRHYIDMEVVNRDRQYPQSVYAKRVA